MQFDGTAWGVSEAAELVAEIDRDLAERTTHYPEQVRKGRLSQTEADYLVALIRDIRSDLVFEFAPLRDGEIRDPNQHKPHVTWHAKVRWIEGELEHRRRRIPELISKGRVTEADGARRIFAIEILRRLYWERMFMWEPPAGPAADYLAALRSAARAGADVVLLRSSEGARFYRELVRQHMAAVELEHGTQGELVA